MKSIIVLYLTFIPFIFDLSFSEKLFTGFYFHYFTDFYQIMSISIILYKFKLFSLFII